MSSHTHGSHCCSSSSSGGSGTTQTLNEMDFERGLWSAALYNELERVKQLLQKPGCNVNEYDHGGYTALHYAARRGHINVCQLLVNAGADVNAITRSGQASSVLRAASMGHLDVVKFLLNSGADGRLVDADGKNILHRACESKNSELINFLKSEFSDLINKSDSRGQLPNF